MCKKFYYKDSINGGLYILKHKESGSRYVEITEKEFYILREQLKPKTEKINQQIIELKRELSNYDYIGVKIATGRATREEYSAEIAKMTELANQINSLREQLKSIK